jgi:hypothetical protein
VRHQLEGHLQQPLLDVLDELVVLRVLVHLLLQPVAVLPAFYFESGELVLQGFDGVEAATVGGDLGEVGGLVVQGVQVALLGEDVVADRDEALLESIL